MPASLAHPVLALAMQNIHQLNTIDADNLSCMWTVFTKCKENLENGRRLENISWRLWYRETMLLDRPYEKLKVTSIGAAELQPTQQKPVVECAPISSLSDPMGSNGLNCMDNVSTADQSPPTTTIPAGTSQEVESSSPKSFMRHLSPLSFQRIISSLVPTGADSSDWKSNVIETSHSAPQPVAPVVVSASETGHTTNSYPRNFAREQHQAPHQQSTHLDHTNAFTTNVAYTPLSQLTYGEAHETSIASFSPRARSVVQGFPATSNVERAPQLQNTKGKFFIDNEDSESDDDDMVTPTSNAFAPKLKMASLPHASSLRSSRPFPPSLVEDDGVINVEYNESGSDWDDATESSTRSLPGDEGIFEKTSALSQREQQLLHPVPRRSLLSSLLAQKSQPQPFLRSSRSVYQDLHTLSTPSFSADSTPQPVPAFSRKAMANQTLRQQYVAPIRSPATIRRDILCSELSESLRRNLLRERQQTNLPYATATSKARSNANALRGRYAEPQVSLNTTPASTALGGDKNLGWFESFRGW
ncbi:hypothetical protein BC936DRAFT_136554 [Jimgerdemannia flammicorona]|uniref:Nitrogen regulatory protein areA GATA-like domain-containing protein n=1 Tax=Jimgerdemannia flammicorona TaxID=994334 RepID=A0A433CZ91_9FUNG|nr:hypothetical protein BC936DRAFT_136554 [Jimgerdemannia flammicorona]